MAKTRCCLARTIVIAAVTLLSCLAPAGAARRANDIPAGRGIRAVDFENFTYNPSCALTVVKAVGGESIPKDGSSRLTFRVVAVAYGDLTGDGREEAAVTTSCNLGGSGAFTEAEVYTLGGGGVELLARVPGGDRAFGGIEGIRIEGGLLVVSRFAPETPTGPACCPRFVETAGYRLEQRRLVQVGGSNRAPYRAPEPGPAAAPGTVTGTITFRQPVVLPAGAEATVRLVDGTDPTAVSIVVERRIPVSSEAPIRFEIRYDPAAIRTTHRYFIEAAVAVGGKVRWAALEPPSVITGGSAGSVEVVVEPI